MRNEVLKMLIVSRKEREIIEIGPQDEASGTTLAEAFADGAIEISLVSLGPTRAKVAIEAPSSLRIRRRNAVGDDKAPR